MTMLWVFLANLKAPFLFAAIPGLIICGLMAYYSGSSEGGRDRLKFAIKTAVWLVVGIIFFQAFPAPDYNVRYVEKPTYIEKKVEVVKYATPQQTYMDIYKQCIESARYSEDDEMKLCHAQAMAAITPPQTVKVVYRYNTYKELFDNCNDNHDGGILALPSEKTIGPRNDRIALCGKLALEGSTVH